MASICDVIEQFLLDTLGDEITLNINRNELAAYFSVSPSQINYVLTTRFTPERGYLIESRRGGGGYVTVNRLQETSDAKLIEIIENAFADGISYARAARMVDSLCADGIMTESEGALVKAAITDRALVAPTVVKDRLRGSILKSVTLELLRVKSSAAEEIERDALGADESSQNDDNENN